MINVAGLGHARQVYQRATSPAQERNIKKKKKCNPSFPTWQIGGTWWVCKIPLISGIRQVQVP